MGAGVIPFSLFEDEIYFLFQSTFTGRKVGHYIDFGGGLNESEDYRDTAAREFVEETETLYFSEDIHLAHRTDEAIANQISLVNSLFDKTLSLYPNWFCRRATTNPSKPKDWITFFIEFPFRDVDKLNNEWERDKTGRFKKRRELTWLSSDELLHIYENSPEKLWKRVRQLEGLAGTIQNIKTEKLSVNL